jgi:hypothetical protein
MSRCALFVEAVHVNSTDEPLWIEGVEADCAPSDTLKNGDTCGVQGLSVKTVVDLFRGRDERLILNKARESSPVQTAMAVLRVQPPKPDAVEIYIQDADMANFFSVEGSSWRKLLLAIIEAADRLTRKNAAAYWEARSSSISNEVSV